MDQGEDVCIGGVFCESGDDGIVSVEVAGVGAIEGAGFDIEDVDEDADGGEDVGFLGCEVGFCECILAGNRCGVSESDFERMSEVYPPQSHRLRTRLPRNLIWLCSTSMVAPSRRTSLAT